MERDSMLVTGRLIIVKMLTPLHVIYRSQNPYWFFMEIESLFLRCTVYGNGRI